MEKINIAQLLKDCPQGMELDCTMLDDVVFEKISFGVPNYPIVLKRLKTNTTIYLTKYGQYSDAEDYKCVIFPKGKTTWEGFVPPREFKDGDIIFTHADSLKMGLDNTWISIFKENSANGVITYAGIKEDGSSYYDNTDEEKGLLCSYNDIVSQSFATEEEKAKLFQAIEKHGYKWDEETKTLTKLIKPKFKVGDRVRSIISSNCYTIVDVKNDQYVIQSDDTEKFPYQVPFSCEINYELVPDKFDINTLIPFESRVLVRNSKDQYWIPAFWGYKAKDGYVTTFGHCKYCIPYKENEHLLGTTNDSNDYYKT